MVLMKIYHHAMCIPAPVPVVSVPVLGVYARVSMSHVRDPWQIARRKDSCTAVQRVPLGPHKAPLNHGIIRGWYQQVRSMRAHHLSSNLSGVAIHGPWPAWAPSYDLGRTTFY